MKAFLFLLFLALHLSSHGQSAVISTPDTRVFCIGLDNVFEVSYPGVPAQDIVVKGDTLTCRILKKSAYQYNAMVMSGSKSCSLFIGILRKGQFQWVDTVRIAVRNFPKGEIWFGSFQNGSYISSERILKQPRLVYHNDAFHSHVEQVRVTKYRLIVLPKRGMMEDLTVLGDSINYEAKKLLEGLKDGDLIVVEGIRTYFFGSIDKPFPPLVLTISDHRNQSPERSGNIRITGYTRSQGQLEHYIYPVDAYSFNKEYIFETDYASSREFLFPKRKDSVWSYYEYSHSRMDYMLYRKDSFYQSKLVCSYYYNDSNSMLEYKLQKANDSAWWYESYHPNGRLYQKGLVTDDNMPAPDHRRRIYRKSSFYENTKYPVRKKKWEKPLFDIHKGWRPISQWEVFDNSGHLIMKLQYTTIPDWLNPTSMEEGGLFYYNYIVVVDGTVTFYKPNGKIHSEILLKDGKEIR